MMLMASGRLWAVSELFSIVGEAFGGKDKSAKRDRGGKEKSPKPKAGDTATATPAVTPSNKARKAKVRAMLSAIEKGAMRPRGPMPKQ